MRAAAPLLWRVLSGIVLLAALLLLLGDPGRLVAALRRGDPVLATAAVVPFAAVFLVEAWRFLLLFEPYDLRYGTALRVTLVGTFLGSFTPGLLGGEAYKVYFAHGRAPGLARPIALLLLLRLAGLGATLALAMLYLVAYPQRAIDAGGGDLLAADWRLAWPWALPARALGLGILLALLLGLGLALAVPRVRALLRRARAAYGEAARAVRQVRPAQAAGLALLSLLIAAARILYLFLLARGFSGDLLLPDLAPVAAAAVVASVLPVTVGGLGTQEGALAAGLVLFGMAYPEAVAVSLLNREFVWAAAAAGWFAMAGGRKG